MQDQQAGAGAASAPAETKQGGRPKGTSLTQIIRGYGAAETEKKNVLVYIDPLVDSDAEGQLRAELDPPGPKTVSDYDDLVLGFGKRRGKPNEWKAAEAVIRSKFVDLYGVLETEDAEIKAAHGSWKNALLVDVELRPLAKAIASLYVTKCRVQGGVEGGE